MTRKWALLMLLHYENIVIISPSITGITYKDDFNFEERYRDVNECNPFYWHPLHLPAYCVNMYESLIRSRLASKTPVRIMTKRGKEKEEIYSLDPHSNKFSYFDEHYDMPFPMYQITGSVYESYDPNYKTKMPLTPYEKMIKQLKKDIKKGPSSPTVTVMPDLGPVALYKQPVSKKSVNMMKQLAEAYVKATMQSYNDYYGAYNKMHKTYSKPNLFIYDSSKNHTATKTKKNKKTKIKKTKENKKLKDEENDYDENDEKEDKNNKVYRMKTKKGGVVTIIETKNLHLLKPDIFSPDTMALRLGAVGGKKGHGKGKTEDTDETAVEANTAAEADAAAEADDAIEREIAAEQELAAYDTSGLE